MSNNKQAQLETTNNQEHILTVVLEDYFQVGSFRKLIPSDYWKRFESRLSKNIDQTIELLAQYKSLATFFVSGWIADNHPELLQKILRHGHDIGCQSYYSQGFKELSKTALIADIKRSKAAVEKAIGQEVRGFRIGRGWLGSKQLWLLDELVEMGFVYDSSLACLGLDFANQNYRTKIHTHGSKAGSLIEVPVTTTKLGFWSVPISGGNYLRQLPARIMEPTIENWRFKHQEPMVLYFHTWELDPEQPKISAAGALQKLRHYRNLNTMYWKIENYLKLYKFTSIERKLGLEPPKAISESALEQDSPVSSAIIDEASLTPLTLVIPCYNEEQTLPYLSNTLARFAKQAAHTFKLHYIFVNDGSSDDTLKILQEQFASKANTHIVSYENNKGIAAAIMHGFSEVKTDLCAVLDADCTFGPEQLLSMFPLLTKDVDIVSASPAHHLGSMQNVSLFRKAMSKGSAFLYSCVLHNKLSSYTSCFRLYRMDKLRDLHIYHNGFCGVTEIMGRLDLHGAKIVEYPATLEVRLLGASKINVMGTVLEHLNLVFKFAKARWFGANLPSRSFVEK